jgi:hypothetical protein
VPRRALIHTSFSPHTPDELLLDHDLMELESLTNGDGTTISSGDIEFVSGTVLRLRNGVRFVRNADNRVLPLIIQGTWGWHEDWLRAWRNSGDAINGLLSPATTQTIPVQDADGADTYGNAPRFRVGQLLRVNAEMMSLLAINTVNNTLTVQRAEQGTGIGTHPIGTAITIYNTPAHIERLIVRWAAWLYKSPEFSMGAGPFHATLPLMLIDEARELRRVRVG